MIGIWLRFSSAADRTPTSAEVLREAIAQACAELKTPVEHVWIGSGPDANQVALFLDIETPGASLAAGISVGTLAAARIPALRFEGPALISLCDHDTASGRERRERGRPESQRKTAQTPQIATEGTTKMGILAGKRILITGVLTEASIAFHVARIAQQEGATVVLTGFGRLSLVQRIARRLPDPPPVLELDVTDEEQLATLAERVSAHVDGLDGVVHGIGNAPASALGGNFLNTPWPDVAAAIQVSAYSLKSLTTAVLPLIGPGGAVVGMDFDASVAWPAYDWMGVAKAALESTARYLARDLGPRGIRVNLISAGPVKTMAARSIPGFERFEDVWAQRAPLGWDLSDAEPTARGCVALLSGWFPATTGEIVHVDGGLHAMGG